MEKYTQESYQKDKDLMEQLKGVKDSKKWEDREQRDTYWNAYYRTEAFIAGGQAATEAKNGKAITSGLLPWSGNHLDDTLAIFAECLLKISSGRSCLTRIKAHRSESNSQDFLKQVGLSQAQRKKKSTNGAVLKRKHSLFCNTFLEFKNNGTPYWGCSSYK